MWEIGGLECSVCSRNYTFLRGSPVSIPPNKGGGEDLENTNKEKSETENQLLKVLITTQTLGIILSNRRFCSIMQKLPNKS